MTLLPTLDRRLGLCHELAVDHVVFVLCRL